ncbi:MAG TPA: adenylate/guanylate cyclase domain-containing protein [Candidatus Nanoarchaeia archaeon]|nr:adenylate/guanylate cyclase domain-containing protein [Candidatus Nanoarchaeia archaeon]
MKLTILVALLTGILLTTLAQANFFYTWNLSLTDALYGGKQGLENIKIIAVDDKSLQEIGRWPWKRTIFGDLLQYTNGAKVVAFDIAFFEPTEDDTVLGDAIRQAGNVIIAKEYDFTRKEYLSPTIEAETGLVNIYTDQDGTSRSIPVKINGEPSLAYKIAQKYIGREPTVDEQRLLVNFASGPGAFKIYSAADVIKGRIDSKEFENSIVLIGATSPDMHDDYIVPTSSGRRMPGVEIHAHAVQTLLTRQFLKHQSTLTLAIVILGLSLITGMLYSKLRIRYAVLILAIIAIAYLIIAIFVFRKGIILNLVYPPITIILTSLTTISYIAASETKHKKHILGIFGKYVSKDVVDHLLKSEKSIELGGIEREVTALFADIRGFTAMSEKMTPHQVIEVLNHYFGDMTDKVFANDGTLDKFIGDALFALWGTPLADKEHAYKAVKCALEIQETLKTRHAKGIPPINLGIGICSGPAVIGNMGSSQRQEFTAIGDTINIASRLSGVSSGGQIIITESTYKHIKDKVDVKKLEPLKVKGKEKALIVYEVVKLLNKIK